MFKMGGHHEYSDKDSTDVLLRVHQYYYRLQLRISDITPEATKSNTNTKIFYVMTTVKLFYHSAS